MAKTAMIETFEVSTRVSVDYSYAVFAFIAVGLVAYLLVHTFRDAWLRYQNGEVTIGDFFTIVTRAIVLLMFFLGVFSAR